ncbi:MAG: RNA methyltransferase [Phycisphaeraceae bacterium]|nr:RNA methyltransferase [Phycisphaeraceae bacterium]
MTDTPLHAIFIEDPADPHLTPYLNQKDAWLRASHNPDRTPGAPNDDKGRFIAEGELVIAQLLRSTFQVESVLTTPARLRRIEQLVKPALHTPPLMVVAQELMDTITGFHVHRGMLACGKRPPATNATDLLARADLVVVLVDLANHDNVGGIFRSVAALGGPRAAVLLTPGCCDPLYRKAIRVSMGQVFHVPWNWGKPSSNALRQQLLEAGFTTIAMSPDALENLSPCLGNSTHKTALLLGPEGPGLSHDWLQIADRRVRIPMAPGVDSLNVTVAASIALYVLGSRLNA